MKHQATPGAGGSPRPQPLTILLRQAVGLRQAMGLPLWMVLRLSMVLLLLLAWPLAAAQCELPTDGISLAIEDFGNAYFREFEADPASGRAELLGGVCIVAEDAGWTLVAERVHLSGFREGERLDARADNATVLLNGWRVMAERLLSDGEVLDLVNVAFTGEGVTGSASRLTVDVDEGKPTARGVRLLGKGFRVEAALAELGGTTLDLSTVVLTTCTCPGDPSYTVSGRSARLDLKDRRVTVNEGHLDLGAVRVPLGDRVELSSAALARLKSPVALEYQPASTTGLGVVFPGLELDEGLSLEMGLLGLDAANPLQGFALVHYRAEELNFSVGRARGGPRADFRMIEPLNESFTAGFAIRNRHEESSDYLHEGLLELRASPPSVSFERGGRVDWHARVFAAASSQKVPAVTVMSPRLGASAGMRLEAHPASGATFTLGIDGRYTSYPAYGRGQYGVTLRPGWHYRLAPWTFTVDYRRRWTDSGSPFTASLDRISPVNTLGAKLAIAGPLGGGADGAARVDFGYDFLRLGTGPPGGLDELGAGFGLSYPVVDWTVAVQTRLELAGLLDPAGKGERKAHFQAGVTGTRGEWEAGTRLRYDLRPGEKGLALLETSLAVPLQLTDLIVTPFLALDFVPTLQNGELPGVSGHGLSLTWASCCGTVRVGYRQKQGSFSTNFGLALENR